MFPLTADGRSLVLKMVYTGQEQMRIFSYHAGLTPEPTPRSLAG